MLETDHTLQELGFQPDETRPCKRIPWAAGFARIGESQPGKLKRAHTILGLALVMDRQLLAGMDSIAGIRGNFLPEYCGASMVAAALRM